VCYLLEHCGIVELSLLYSENDSQLVATLHSAHDFPREIEKASSKSSATVMYTQQVTLLHAFG